MIYPQLDLPIYEQKSAAESQVIQLNHNYIWPLGVLRALIIVNILKKFYYNMSSFFLYYQFIRNSNYRILIFISIIPINKTLSKRFQH